MSAGSEVKLTDALEADDAYELQDHEFSLELDEAPGAAGARPRTPPPPPPGRRSTGSYPLPPRAPELRARHGSGVFSRPAEADRAFARESLARPPAVEAMDRAFARDDLVRPTGGDAAEIARLRAQLRARDAYLAELERALDERTRQLSLAGIASLADVARLQGRLRGQAFRIAELESELRRMTLHAAELRAAARSGEQAGAGELQRVRGIGPRYAAQLAELGIERLAQVAAWTAEDVSRVATQLRITSARIEREGWVDQARALRGLSVELDDDE